MNKIISICISLFCSSSMLLASNLANPLAPIPTARVSIGMSYHLGGYTITNRAIPSLMNRYYCRISYAPITYCNFGVDLGLTQIEVAYDSTKSPAIGIFHGDTKFSYGAHIKLSSPLLKGLFGLIGIAQATSFQSENKYGAWYGGYDAAGAIGILTHIKHFGYIAAGAKIYYIKGENKDHDSNTRRFYSNHNNIRGWFAIDYFPKLSKIISTHIPHISFEVSVTPDVGINHRAPIQEVSFSIAIGTITKRLYGEISEVEWRP